MPRGPRQPSPTANRTDRATPSPAPIQVSPGQTYGEAADQQTAQRQLPTANGPTMVPGGAPPQPPASAADIMAMATAHNGPGSQPFTRATERPNEPVTHGIPGGPGAGPEALQGVGAAAREGVVESGTLRNLLTSLASQPGATQAIQDLASRASAGAA